MAVANFPPQPFFSVYFGPLKIPLARKSSHPFSGASPLSGSLGFHRYALLIFAAKIENSIALVGDLPVSGSLNSFE